LADPELTAHSSLVACQRLGWSDADRHDEHGQAHLLANLLANGPLERDLEAFSLVGVTGIGPVTSAV